VTEERGPIPIACSLDAEEARDQVASWQQLRPWVRRTEAHERGVTMWFDGTADDAVRRVAEAEAACCAFLSFRQATDGDGVRLDVECDVDDGVAVAHFLAAQVAEP
jgi:hypothetical protein